MIKPQLPGSNPATVTENEEETAKGENPVSCFLNYFMNPPKFFEAVSNGTCYDGCEK